MTGLLAPFPYFGDKRSLDVLPVQAADYLGDVGLLHAEAVGEVDLSALAGGVEAANLKDIVLSQASHPVLLSVNRANVVRFDRAEPSTGPLRADHGCDSSLLEFVAVLRARKRTWLLCRMNPRYLPPEIDWSRPVGTHQVGWFDRIKPTLSKKEANATPTPFRDLLLAIARSSTPTTARERVS